MKDRFCLDKPAAHQVQSDHFEHTFDYLYAGKARKSKSDPDAMSWDEAMRSPYRDEFIQAAKKEIDELTAKGAWVEDLRFNATTGIIFRVLEDEKKNIFFLCTN